MTEYPFGRVLGGPSSFAASLARFTVAALGAAFFVVVSACASTSAAEETSAARAGFEVAAHSTEAATQSARARPKKGRVRAYGSSTTLRPRSVSGGKPSKRIKLLAARNEFESFQLRIDAKRRKLRGVTVRIAGPLRGPDGAEISMDDVTLYRAATYQVKSAAGKPRSSRQGAQGLWPDPLIPEVDPYYRENRSAFPMTIKRGSGRIVWGDIYVGRNLPPGTYRGTVQVDSKAGRVGRVPVKLTVIDHAIPSTSSLRNAFLNTPPGYVPCRAHWAVDWCYQENDRNWRLAYLYTRAALENRVTIPNLIPGGFDQPPDPAKFRDYVLPLIAGEDGGGIAGTEPPRLRGARLTSVVAMWQCIVSNNGCLAEWRRLADNHGFTDRFISYVCDEPTLQRQPEYWNDWRDCRDNAALARQRFPESKTLVTAWIQNARQAEREDAIAVERDIDILTPLVNYLVNRPGNPQAGNQRPAYNQFLGSDSRKELWAYTACPQFSCDELEAPYFDGWPAYVIDQPAPLARAMGWAAHYYNLRGELYHNVSLALRTAWKDQYRWGGNGDGTLFYPGTPDGFRGSPAIGGEHDIPIESMRLKRIRDGREDYELLRAASRTGGKGADTVENALRRALGDRDSAMYSTAIKQRAVNRLRCKVMRVLDPVRVPTCG